MNEPDPKIRPRGIDFHCHLDLFPDHEAAIARAEAAAIYTLTVTTTPRAWTRNHALTRNCRFVRAALGLHPQLVGERESELALWDPLEIPVERWAAQREKCEEIAAEATECAHLSPKAIEKRLKQLQSEARRVAANAAAEQADHDRETYREMCKEDTSYAAIQAVKDAVRSALKISIYGKLSSRSCPVA